MTEVPAAMSIAEDAMVRAMNSVLPPELSAGDPLVRRSEHADLQSNAALALAKQVHTPPRDLARTLADALGADGYETSVSGPGFINLTIPTSRLWKLVTARLSDQRAGVGEPLTGRRIVIDYSGPNIAKEMHVGHLRTTVIGDCLARVLAHLGADVVRQNHLGDWGTQFGMLIEYINDHPDIDWRATQTAAVDRVSVLDGLYRAARATFDADEDFAERARKRVVDLQGGDEATMETWRDLVAVSTRAFQDLYDRLGVLLTPDDADGESGYNAELDTIVTELLDAGIAVESNGAVCVFFDDITGSDGEPLPMIVRKRDGGYGYAATDLATLRRRVRQMGADEILYVVDARQALHFRMVFATARRAGWLTDDVKAVHVPFGTVTGPGGKPFKTRSGATVRLTELLDAAVDAARAVVADKPHDLSGAALEHVITSAGIGAVKYADLSTSRTKNYAFDIDHMVSLAGNTGVYLQYAHTRVRSILRSAPIDVAAITVDPMAPMHPTERGLILQLDGFGTALQATATDLEPHQLCGYLYTLAKAFTEFYGACPVLKAETAVLRSNRLALCELTATTLARGLDLLGLEAPDRM